MWNNPCQMTMYPGCAGLTPHFTLKGGELVWVSSALHASWEFLFPVLCRDPCPLKLQLLFDVLLFTLLKEHGVLVAGGWQKVQYLFYRINVASYDGDYMVLKLLWLCWQPLRGSVRVIERVGKPMEKRLVGQIRRATLLRECWKKEKNTHCAVRHSFSAAFSSRHFNTIKKPDSLQQWLKAGGRRKVAERGQK